MKTMLELLIRLQELRRCCERASLNPQISNGEKAIVSSYKCLVRECLPDEVLAEYDRMKKSEPQLLLYPEIFAMAVVLSTWRNLSRRQQWNLVNYFAIPSGSKRELSATMPKLEARNSSKRRAALPNRKRRHRERPGNTLGISNLVSQGHSPRKWLS